MDHGDVEEGARIRQLMCQDGSVEEPTGEPSTMTRIITNSKNGKIATLGLDLAKSNSPVWWIQFRRTSATTRASAVRNGIAISEVASSAIEETPSYRTARRGRL